MTDLIIGSTKKYGPTLDEVLATRERLTDELGTLDQSEDRLIALHSEVDTLAKEALGAAAVLTKARKNRRRRVQWSVNLKIWSLQQRVLR